MDDGGLGDRRSVNRAGLTGEAKAGRARKERKIDFSGHRRTLYCSSLRVGGSGATDAAARDQYKSKPNRFGKRIGRFDSPSRQSRPDLPNSVYFA
jgi:hypothetical protein